jgi:hypothetical protein
MIDRALAVGLGISPATGISLKTTSKRKVLELSIVFLSMLRFGLFGDQVVSEHFVCLPVYVGATAMDALDGDNFRNVTIAADPF